MNDSNIHPILYIGRALESGELFQRAVQSQQYSVDIACAGQDGLSLFADSQYEIVAVDCQLSDMSGIDVVRIIRGDNPELPILMVMNKGEEALVAEAMSLGVTNYVCNNDEAGYLELTPMIIAQLLQQAELEVNVRSDKVEDVDDSAGYRLAFDNIPYGVSILTQEDPPKRLYVNQRFIEMMGASSMEELLEQSPFETFVNPGDLYDLRRLSSSGNFTTYVEMERVRPDGTRWWCQLQRRELVFDGQRVIVAWHEDITDRKKMEQGRDRLLFAIEHVPLSTALFDENDELVNCNASFREIMDVVADILRPGVTFETMFRTLVERRPMPESDGREEEYIQERLAKHRNPQGPFEIVRSGGTFQVNEGRISDGSTFLMFENITQRVQAEEDRRQALFEAEQANQAKTEFLATMSHEFRTPLNAILGFSEMLRAQYFGPLGAKNYKEYANDIHHSGEHMLALINDILDISAIEAGKRELARDDVDIHEVLSHCIRNLDFQACEKNIRVSLETTGGLSQVTADRRSIVQVFQNLLSNAIKFTNPEGKVSVSVEDEDSDIVIVLKDTGIGIPKERIQTITDPFSRVISDPHLAQEGTGLGLSIVKSLVEAQCGKLQIDSEVGTGTTVTVTFPPQDTIAT